MKTERIVRFKPAYDKRSDDPKKNYGIHSVQCWMIVRGKKGAVHFTFSTGMLLPETMADYIDRGQAKYEKTTYGHYYLNKPMGYDVGYHTPKPQFKGQEVRWPTRMVKPKGVDFETEPLKALEKTKFVKIGKKAPVCEWIGVPCCCDGSAMRAEEWMNILIKEGSDKIWKMLEEDYKAL